MSAEDDTVDSGELLSVSADPGADAKLARRLAEPASALLTMTPDRAAAWLGRWPPYTANGISVTSLAPDWTQASVRLDVRSDNANVLGTAFGGGLFTMLDGLAVLLLARQLGPGYLQWDQRAEIDFLRPVADSVTGTVDVPATRVRAVRNATRSGAPYSFWLTTALHTPDGGVAAIQRREIYVRRRVKMRTTGRPRSSTAAPNDDQATTGEQ